MCSYREVTLTVEDDLTEAQQAEVIHALEGEGVQVLAFLGSIVLGRMPATRHPDRLLALPHVRASGWNRPATAA
jgi:hypothetical protein